MIASKEIAQKTVEFVRDNFTLLEFIAENSKFPEDVDFKKAIILIDFGFIFNEKNDNVFLTPNGWLALTYEIEIRELNSQLDEAWEQINGEDV